MASGTVAHLFVIVPFRLRRFVFFMAMFGVLRMVVALMVVQTVVHCLMIHVWMGIRTAGFFFLAGIAPPACRPPLILHLREEQPFFAYQQD